MFLDSGWMESLVRKYIRREITDNEYKNRIRSINEFERQLRDGGYIILKLFLHIDREEQLKRLESLYSAPETRWRVTDDDLWQNREYSRFFKAYDEVMEKTDKSVKWHILDARNRKTAVRDALKLLVELVEKALKNLLPEAL